MQEVVRSIIDDYEEQLENLPDSAGFGRDFTPENAISNVLHEKLLKEDVSITEAAADFLSERVYQEALLNKLDIDTVLDEVVRTLKDEHKNGDNTREKMPLTLYIDRKVQQQELQKDIETSHGYICVNETVEPFLPYLEGKEEALVAIGVHQGLDVLANSDLSFGALVDIDPTTSYTTRLMLEYSAYYTNVHGGTLPTAREIAGFFDFHDEDNLKLAKMLLQRGATSAEESRIDSFIEGIENKLDSRSKSSRINSYTHYLLVQSTLDGSWLSSPEKIKKITQMYMNGDIFVIRGDMTDDSLPIDINNLIHKRGMKVDALYMSNAEGYFRKPMNLDAFEVNEDAIIMRTVDTLGFAVDSSFLLPKLPVTKSRQRFEIEWHYNVQSVKDFKRKMQERKDSYFHPSVGIFSDIYHEINDNDRDFSNGISAIGI